MAEEVETAPDLAAAPDGEAESPAVDTGVDWKRLALIGVGMLAAGVVGLAVNEYIMRRFAAKRAAAAQAYSEQAYSEQGQTPPPSQPPPPPAESGETGTSVPKHLAPIEHLVESPVRDVELEELVELEEEGEASERLGG